MTFLPKPPAQGPATGFEAEVLALRPALCAFARRLLRQEADVEDLVQDTIVRALSARHRFREGTNLKAWLFTIQRNAFNTRWRRARRETMPGPAAIEAGAVTEATQGTTVLARETMEHLMRDLSPAHRQILLLVAVLGLAYEDAATVCGCSVGTIKSRLSRARAALAALVDESPP